MVVKRETPAILLDHYADLPASCNDCRMTTSRHAGDSPDTNPAIPQFDLADKMRKALRHADLGVGEMADYLGVSRNTVGTWINGRIAPSRQTILLWALKTGVPAEWLLDQPRSGPDGPDDGAECPRPESNRRPTR
jgi:DNA-binding transcriptional regulator YiaG